MTTSHGQEMGQLRCSVPFTLTVAAIAFGVGVSVALGVRAGAVGKASLAGPAATSVKPRPSSTATMPLGMLPQQSDGSDAPRSYRLGSDDPRIKADRNRFVARTVERCLAEHDAKYSDLFRRLGMNEAQMALFKDRMGSLYRAKAQAHLAASEFESTRLDYVAKMKQVLGPNYDLYAKFEAESPATTEAEEFGKFLAQRGGSISNDDAARVRPLIQDASAYGRSQETWGGPLQDIPPALAGVRAAAFLQNRIGEVSASATKLLEQARQQRLDATTITALESYYQAQANSYAESLQAVRHPEIRLAASITMRLEEAQKALSPDPVVIARLQKQLQSLTQAPANSVGR